MRTPFDLAQQHAEAREHAASDQLAGALRVAEWNEQMDGVIRSIRAAAERDCGIIIEVTNLANRITARPSKHVPAGTATVFDLDSGTTYRRTLRLTEPKD